MNRDPLQELLLEADASGQRRFTADGGLGRRVRRMHRHRRRYSLAVGGGLTVAVAAVVMAGLLSRPHSPGRPGPTTAEGSELPRLHAEIKRREDELALLLAIERRVKAARRLRQTAASTELAEPVQQQLDRTAATILSGADLKYRHFALTESAKNDYRQLAEMFPETIWAETAAARLAAIDSE